MNKSTQPPCFFVDSSVLIREILLQHSERIAKFKADASNHSITCFFSDSVRRETEKKVRQTTDFIGDTIRTNLINELMSFRRQNHIAYGNPLTNEDIKALEKAFNIIHGSARFQKTLTDPVSLIEEWTIAFLAERIEKGVHITIQELGVELISSVLKLASTLQSSFDYLMTYQRGFVKEKGLPLSHQFALIKANLESEGIHAPDSDHIASAILNKQLNSQKTVFVTLDFSTILCRRETILSMQDIVCCDPLYAIHHIQ